MKSLTYIVLFLFTLQLFAQQQAKDTVRIKSVDIQAKQTVFVNQEKIDSAILSHPQHTNLGDLLSKKSHLFIKSYGIGSLATVSLRGSGSEHTQINWNGISLNSCMNGTSDLALFPLLFMDEVDVKYGLSSVADGAGGIGGAVNISSQPNFKKQLRGAVAYTVGSFGQEQWNGKLQVGDEKLQSVTKLFKNTAANNFQYQDLTQEGFPTRKVQNASLEQHGIMQNIQYKLKENQWIEASFWWFESMRNLPPLITLRDNEEFQEDNSIRSLISYTNYLKSSKLKVTVAYLDDQINYRNERASINSTSASKSLKSRIDYDFTWKGIGFKSQLKASYDRAIADGLSVSVVQSRVEAFGSANRKIGRRFNFQLAARELVVLQESSYFLPQAKLGYANKSGKWYSHAKMGKNVKSPSLNDLYFEPSGNVDLVAEESMSSEVSVARLFSLSSYKYLGRISATGFYNSIENYIQWQPTAFGFWRPVNLKSVETYGVEVFAEIKQEQGVIKKQLTGTYSYTSSRNWEKHHEFDESYGKQLIYIPEHKGNLAFDLEYKDYNLTTNLQAIGVRFISSDNSDLLPAYTLLDLSLGKIIHLKKHSLACSLGVKNVLDVEYQAIEWRPMPNRNYFAKLSYQFKK